MTGGVGHCKRSIDGFLGAKTANRHSFQICIHSANFVALVKIFHEECNQDGTQREKDEKPLQSNKMLDITLIA